MKQLMTGMVLGALLSLSMTTGAFAQGSSTAAISGVVVDADRAVIPGADVVVTNKATGETFNTVTSGQGVFAVPSLVTGTYTVTISLNGFKTARLRQRGGQCGRARQRARDAGDRRRSPNR